MKNGEQGYSFLLGWMLLRPARHEWLNQSVPQPLLSASNCICEVRPNMDDWYEEQERLDFLREHERNVEGNFIFLDNLASAHEMNGRWFNGELRPVALALRPQAAQDLDDILRHYQTNANRNNPIFKYTPLEAQTFTGKERLLGFEVLSYSWGWHSYLCCGLEAELMEQFGGLLNAQGLITDGDTAERFAEACNQHEWGEPGLNLAYAFYEIA